MTLSLRAATAADLMPIGALHHRSRLAAYASFIPADALATLSPVPMGQWWTERWRYERDTHRMTVAERDGDLVGFSYLGPDDEGDPTVGLLNAIHLAPEHVGTGLGRALMIDALAAMHERGCRSAALWVYAENRHARDFYQRGGWRPDGTVRTEEIAGFPVQQLRYTRPLP